MFPLFFLSVLSVRTIKAKLSIFISPQPHTMRPQAFCDLVISKIASADDQRVEVSFILLFNSSTSCILGQSPSKHVWPRSRTPRSPRRTRWKPNVGARITAEPGFAPSKLALKSSVPINSFVLLATRFGLMKEVKISFESVRSDTHSKGNERASQCRIVSKPSPSTVRNCSVCGHTS